MSGRSKRSSASLGEEIATPPTSESPLRTSTQSEPDLRPAHCTVHEAACWFAGETPATTLADAKRQVLEGNANSLAGRIYRAVKEDVLAGKLSCLLSSLWFGYSRLAPIHAIDWAKPRGLNVPSALAMLAEDAELTTVEIDGTDQDNPEARLAALFDGVGAAQLETMFPAEGQWRKWAGRAHVNGLKEARVGRGKFNPYRAALWWLDTKHPMQWSWEQCARRLAKNLPSRSRGSESMLTGVDE